MLPFCLVQYRPTSFPRCNRDLSLKCRRIRGSVCHTVQSPIASWLKGEYSCSAKPLFWRFGNRLSGTGNHARLNRSVSEIVMWLPWLTIQFARGSMSRMAARPPKGLPLHGEGKLLPYLGTATLDRAVGFKVVSSRTEWRFPTTGQVV
jgi:hypothetical protein